MLGVTASKSRQVETGQVSAQESSLSDEEEEEEEIKEDDEASADRSKWTGPRGCKLKKNKWCTISREFVD